MLVVGIGEGCSVFWNRECRIVSSEVLGTEIGRLLFLERELRKQIAVRWANSSGAMRTGVAHHNTRRHGRYVAGPISRSTILSWLAELVVGIDVTGAAGPRKANRLRGD
jgi:hypothetical protein